MILLEINDEAGVTHYEVLGISPEELAGLDNSTIARKVLAADARARKACNAELKGVAAPIRKAREEKLARIGKANIILSKQDTREAYDKELKSGHSGPSEILRVRHIAPLFFSDRKTRFQIIERLMQEAGFHSSGDN